MQRIITLSAVLAISGLLFACGNSSETHLNTSPTEAYKSLFAAVKAKDTGQIKQNLTKRTIEFGVMAAERSNVKPEKVYENGFTSTTFAEKLPPIRDERIRGEMGAIEVWNSRESKWEDLPFMLEDGSWKLAIAETFAGVFQSPGFGIDRKAKEAANALAGNKLPTTVNSNVTPSNNLKMPVAPTTGNK